jgi:hypothetical protein
MTSPAKPDPIPDSYRRVTPCLTIQGAAKALEFQRVMEIEVANLDEALRMVRTWPGCPIVEIRPLES